MTTLTRGKRAASTVAPKTGKTTRVVELDKSFKPLFDELSEVTLARQEAEKREKDIKAAILEAAGQPADTDVTLAVRVAGAIRGKISLRRRTSVNAKDLQAAFPEAYEATSYETEYAVVSPA